LLIIHTILSRLYDLSAKDPIRLSRGLATEQGRRRYNDLEHIHHGFISICQKEGDRMTLKKSISISDAQYTWLAKDFGKAQGKHIFVITHIPPRDPRSGVTTNNIPDYVNAVKSG
jgi:hypothetical protein